MTRRTAWIIESPASLQTQTKVIGPLLEVWQEKHDLEGECFIGGGEQALDGRPPEAANLTLVLDATPAQMNELAASISQAVGAPMYPRRAEMVAIEVRDMRTMKPSGDVQWVEVDLLERARQRREAAQPEERELN